MDPKALFRNTSYAERARAVIKELILSGDYRPGQRLKEVEISQTLGISRSPVREAIQSLASEGLVKIVPHRGAFVADFQPGEVAELYEVREALEVMAASLAAERAESSQVKELEAVLEATRDVLNESAGYPPDLDFHRHIAELSQNAKLAQRIAEILSQLELVRRRSAATQGRAQEAYKEHVAIFEALQQHDSGKASESMRRHIRSSMSNMVGVMKANGPAQLDNR